MLELKQLYSQTLIYGFSSVLARVLNFLLVPLYTSIFLPSEYAIVTEMYAYAAMLMILGSFGMETSMFRYINKYKKQDSSTIFSTAFAFVFFNAITLLIIGSVFYQSISNSIGYNNNPEYVLYFAFIIAFDLITIIPFALLRQQNKAKSFALIKTINIIINIFCNVLFFIVIPFFIKSSYLQFSHIIGGYTISVEYVFLSNLIASFVTIIFLMRIINKNLSSFDYSIFKKMLKYAAPILVAGIAFVINESADKILLKYLLPKSVSMRELGIYSACYKLTIFMTLFVQAYRYAAEPFFFNKFNQPNSKKIYSLMLQLFALVSGFIFLLIVLNLEIVKLIIPNPLYHEGVKIIPIVLLANIFLGIYYNLSVWYKVIDKTYYAAIISTIGALITIVFNILLIPKIGYMGAAWSTMLCYLSMMAISFVLGRRNYFINYNVYKSSSYIIIAILILFLSSVSKYEIYNNIQIDNTIFILLYTIFMYKEIKKIFKQNKNKLNENPSY